MTNLPTIADHLARIAIMASIYGALAMATFLLFLVMRRDRKERRLALTLANTRALTREIMTALAGNGSPGMAFEHASDADRVTAINHISQLVRGDDHERLTRFVEDNHLLDGVAVGARHGRSARRVDSIRLMGGIGGDRSVAILRDILLNDRDHAVRLEAAAMLAQLGALPPPDVLIAALDLENTPISRLHRALFRSLAPACSSDLLRLVKWRAPPGLRALLVDSLGWTENYSGLDALADAARDENIDVRCAALRAARKINHPASAGWVFALLKDADETVRSQAVLTCAQMGLRRAVPELREMRSDSSAWVRLRVAEALDALEGRAA